jgi:MerR family transcriptional regulator, light-induced transcriptional regulator
MLCAAGNERKVVRPGQTQTWHHCTAMHRVDTGGQATISATRFADLTGVSRERLRTWERRFGFPVPLRTGHGPRRYAVDDVARVVAVRRAAETGVPLAHAIARTPATAGPAAVGAATFTALVEHAPVPVVVLSGPEPLRIEWANAALRTQPGAPRAGDDLVSAIPAFAEAPCTQALLAFFAADVPPAEVEHPSWEGRPRHSGRSMLYRLPVEPGRAPLVAMVGLEGHGEREVRMLLSDREHELVEVQRTAARHTRWLDAIAQLADRFRLVPGEAAIDEGLDAVVRQIRAIDGAIAYYVSGQLMLTGSRRGLLAPRPVTVAAHPQLVTAISGGGEPAWLDLPARNAFGVPEDLQASAVPIVVAGEPLGLLLFVFAEVEPHDPDNSRLLAAVSATMGFALLRDRLTAELRDAAGLR